VTEQVSWLGQVASCATVATVNKTETPLARLLGGQQVVLQEVPLPEVSRCCGFAEDL